MEKRNIREKQAHKNRVCSLHGVCGREPLIFSLHEITIYGLEILSGSRK